MPKKQTSEFGKGFVYSLILFSKHWWRHSEWLQTYKEMRKTNPKLFSDEMALESWFNGASDHFYELEIPSQFKNKKIGQLAKWLQSKALYWGHGFQGKPTKKDFEEVFDKLEELARLIDKELGVKTIEASWK